MASWCTCWLVAAVLLRDELAAASRPMLASGGATGRTGPGRVGLSQEQISHLAEQLQSGNDKAADGHSTRLDELAESYRYAVVRIMMVERTVDWLRPYTTGRDLTFIGSGFAVSLMDSSDVVDAFDVEDPIFITNAHVVQNAHTVLVQIPSVSKAQFPAYVPIIYEEMDLAVVRLVLPQVFTQFLKANKKKLMVLPVRSEAKVEMGMEVAALGFPLGCERLKLSRGVIAGTEQVSGHVRYQSTAPISPGSSGGPLLKLSESDGLHTTIVGVNFAAASSVMAQNANYVVPVVHIAQLLTELKKRAPEERQRIANISAALQERGFGGFLQETVAESLPALKHLVVPSQSTSSLEVASSSETTLMTVLAMKDAISKSGALADLLPLTPSHTQLRVGGVDIVKVEGNEELYSAYGCTGGGVFIAQLGQSSVLQSAVPPVQGESFLYEVNSVRIDRFGNGAEQGAYLNDPIPFESMMYEMENLATNVTVKSCKDGQNYTHSVSMQWRPEYESGIRSIFEPYFEPQALEYESFASIFVMQLNIHHLWALLDYTTLPLLGQFVQRGQQPRLVVASVLEGTYASRVLVPGMVLSTLNGHKVTTLEEYRAHFEPEDGKPWRLLMESGEIFQVSFLDSFQSQMQMVQQGMLELNTTAVWAAFLRRVALQELRSQLDQNRSSSEEHHESDDKLTLDRLEAEAYRRGYEKALKEVQERAKLGNQPILTQTNATVDARLADNAAPSTQHQVVQVGGSSPSQHGFEQLPENETAAQQVDHGPIAAEPDSRTQRDGAKEANGPTSTAPALHAWNPLDEGAVLVQATDVRQQATHPKQLPLAVDVQGQHSSLELSGSFHTLDSALALPAELRRAGKPHLNFQVDALQQGEERSRSASPHPPASLQTTGAMVEWLDRMQRLPASTLEQEGSSLGTLNTEKHAYLPGAFSGLAAQAGEAATLMRPAGSLQAWPSYR